MAMNSPLPIIFSLIISISFNAFPSFASELSYKDHCASIVPGSTPTRTDLRDEAFPFGWYQTGYYTGGGRVLGVDYSRHKNSFHLKIRNIKATGVSGLFKIEASLSFRSSYPYNYEENSTYGPRHHYHRRFTILRLDGFWSEPSGKLCMIGIGTGYSKAGNLLHLDAVFRLHNVFNSSNVGTLVNGSLESLSSENDVNYFEPITVYMLPGWNYKYSLDTIKAKEECSAGSDVKEVLPTKSLSFCSTHISWAIRDLRLEYSSDCNAAKNCTPFKGTPGHLPSFLSLKQIECNADKQRMRVQVRFLDTSYYDQFYWEFNPNTTLIGEGWWNEGKNRICIVACLFSSESLSSAHEPDCSVRMSLKIPLTWTIKQTSGIMGKIWSNKTVNDSGYFKEIMFTRLALSSEVVAPLKIFMVCMSTTLACAFLMLQIFQVKKHPNVLPFVSVFIFLILTLGYLINKAYKMQVLMQS
ncbi:hypothetical protein L6164_022586 [Bauhinia variegata]|uniref:Uncharacterized protein n=1 Tax=Bauhinia variegata TaxID=167791 RepID=A0ACB9MHG9_BAUVA|nr:hypothetical protein L6164_022586 [Bauhinia variegata]